MIILPDNEEAIAAAIVILRDGGVVAHATETCYGFACDMTNETAVRKLFAIKERSEDHPVSALFPSVEEAKHYVLWNEEAEKLAADSLPGPLTLILPLLSSAPQKLFPIPSIQSPTPTLGIRVSSHPLACRLAAAFVKPISTTSANLHGQQNPYCAEDILLQFAEKTLQPDLIIDSGRLPPTPPSKIVDLTKGGEVVRNA